LTTHISPVAITDLARYITEVTKRNEFLEVRVQELLEANNREVERRRDAEAQVQHLMKRLLGVPKPEVKDAKTEHRKEEVPES